MISNSIFSRPISVGTKEDLAEDVVLSCEILNSWRIRPAIVNYDVYVHIRNITRDHSLQAVLIEAIILTSGSE